jgi:hypothetical protein
MGMAQSIRSFFDTLFPPANIRYIQHLEQEVQRLVTECSYLGGKLERLELNASSSALHQQSRRPAAELPDSSIDPPGGRATFAGGWTKILNAHIEKIDAEGKKA